MNAIARVLNAYTDSDVHNTLLNYRVGKYTSVRKYALAYNILV